MAEASKFGLVKSSSEGNVVQPLRKEAEVGPAAEVSNVWPSALLSRPVELPHLQRDFAALLRPVRASSNRRGH